MNNRVIGRAWLRPDGSKGIRNHVAVVFTVECAEHVARFRLMDEATQNAQRLMEELQMELLSAKRQMVTREMQELAVGAGLLKR